MARFINSTGGEAALGFQGSTTLFVCMIVISVSIISMVIFACGVSSNKLCKGGSGNGGGCGWVSDVGGCDGCNGCGDGGGGSSSGGYGGSSGGRCGGGGQWRLWWRWLLNIYANTQ
ncbi:hypothetical protein NMG60_11029976 [Bertholletia excelsa]